MPGTFHSAAIPESVARWKEWDGELDDIRLVFSCLLKCERAICGAVVAASGTGYVEDISSQEREEGEEPYIEVFEVRSFTPPLSAFTIPSQFPENVAKPLRLSFALFLNSPGSAANAIRIALEELMNALGVAEMRVLHRRIEALPPQYAEHKRALMAIKILGNAGSHQVDRVTAQDIEQAYTIIEFVLRKIYGGSTESIHHLIARLEGRFSAVSSPE